MSTNDPLIPREELHAALEARRELGAERDPELVDAFLDRIERGLEQRLDERRPATRDTRGDEQRRFVLALVSLLAAVPLTAIAIVQAGLVALVVVWVGIVLVNVVVARRS